MEGYVADPAVCEVVEEIRHLLANLEFDENVYSVWLHLFKSLKVFKIALCELIVERIEDEIQWLDEQIQSYDFQDPKKFLEILPPSKQKIIDLPTDIYIDNVQLEVCIAELGQPTETGFRDPIAAYMEMFFSLMDKSGCLFCDQGQYVHEELTAITYVSSWQHSQAASFSGLLEWLIWHFSIT